MNHHDAKKFCKSLDNRAYLVEIRTKEIQNFVRSLDLSSNTWWWIGVGPSQARLGSARLVTIEEKSSEKARIEPGSVTFGSWLGC